MHILGLHRLDQEVCGGGASGLGSDQPSRWFWSSLRSESCGGGRGELIAPWVVSGSSLHPGSLRAGVWK